MLRAAADQTLVPMRIVNGSDSLAAIGANVKGRSQSHPLDGRLRPHLALALVSRKMIYNFHVSFEMNPSDDVPLITPKVPHPWLEKLAGHSDGCRWNWESLSPYVSVVP